jgi:hypothetical protein
VRIWGVGQFDGRGMFEVWRLDFCLEVERERMWFGRDDNRMRKLLVLSRGERAVCLGRNDQQETVESIGDIERASYFDA